MDFRSLQQLGGRQCGSGCYVPPLMSTQERNDKTRQLSVILNKARVARSVGRWSTWASLTHRVFGSALSACSTGRRVISTTLGVGVEQ